MKDYYKILGISPNASDDEIKKAYKKKAKSCHPDLFPDDKEKEEEFKLINEAQDALLNKPKENITPIPNIPRQYVNVDITLKDLYCDSEVETEYYVGKEKCTYCNGYGRIRMQKQSLFGIFINDIVCPHCNGTGKVGDKIKKTYKTTAKELVANRIEFNEDGVQIIIGAHLIPIDNWKLQHGGNLLHQIDINVPLAVLGGKKEITFLDDSKIEVTIPKGIQIGDCIKIEGKGITPDSDLFIKVNIVIPTELTEKEEQLYKKLLNG